MELKTYKLKKSNDNFLGMSLIIALIGSFYIMVNYTYLYHSFVHHSRIAYILFGVALWFSYSLRGNYKIKITDGVLTIKGGVFGRAKSIECANIAMIKYHRARLQPLSTQRVGGKERMEILTSGGRYFFKCSSVSQQQEMRDFLNGLVSEIQTIAQYDKDWKIDYINPLYRDTPVVKRNIGNSRQKRSLIWALLCFALFLIFFVPKYENYLNSFILEGQYYVKDDGVYFWKTKIQEADPATFVILDPFFVGKDSTYAFCRGEILKNVDVSTLRMLGGSGKLYLDKNNLYGVSPRLFPPPTELWPINDTIIDVATIEVIGEMYKDKNNLYSSELVYPYIKKLEMPPGLNLDSFKYIPKRKEYTDNNKIYKYSPGEYINLPD